jgi:hypothetical protein
MAVTAIITMLCVAGMAFNVRFFAAMCKEHGIVSNEITIRKQREHKPAARSA